jgi:nicotinamide-nucleotide amidase
MNAIILSIGDELITGQTVDTNSAYLSRRLAERGVATAEHVTVPDSPEAITAALSRAAGRADVVLVTGGLGPTEDDVTREALARAMGAELVLNQRNLEQIEKLFLARRWPMHESNRRQAMLPAGAEALENPVGTAPGIAARLGLARVFVMPGVPSEMEVMFRDQVEPRLPHLEGAILHRVLHTFGEGESTAASRIADLMKRGANPLVGTTVAAGLVSVRVVSRGRTPQDAQRLAADTVATLRQRLGDLVVGEGDESMASAVGDLLRARRQTLAVAESCTGGMLGQMITVVPGASDYFLGGLVTYANGAKTKFLDVPGEMLKEHGAVSEPVARTMAERCRERFGSDWALSVTGIAGPGGGTEEKPVGLVHMGLAGPGGVEATHRIFGGTRPIVRLRASLAAMNNLRLALLRK